MINIKCVCGELYHADENFIGKKIRCSKCGSIINIELPIQQTTHQSVNDSKQTEKKENNFRKTKQQHRFVNKIRSLLDIKIVVYSLYFLFVIGIFSLYSYLKDSNSVENQENRPTSGNVYNENIKPVVETNNQENKNINPSIESNINPYADWEKVDLITGTTPDCFNYTPTYDLAIENELSVNVGNNTDVVLKLCSFTTNKCIRYVYIRSNETYSIKNIPQDKYYTKIAYGTDWRQKIHNSQCIGKFTHNALYKKGEKIMDFHKQFNGNHIQIPYFSLSLNVSATDSTQRYYTNSISEGEFNK
jgi:hypothetical protein